MSVLQRVYEGTDLQVNEEEFRVAVVTVLVGIFMILGLIALAILSPPAGKDTGYWRDK